MMDENKIQVKRQVVPSFLGSKPMVTWGITCPDEDCYSPQDGINAPPSAGWQSQEVAMRVADRHAREVHPKPFTVDIMRTMYLSDSNLVSLSNSASIPAGTVVSVDGSGRVRPVRQPDSELVWTDSIGRELRAKYSRFHGVMLSVDGHWVYLGQLEEGVQALEDWLSKTIKPASRHEHDETCAFGNPQCPAFAESSSKEDRKGFWDWLMGR